MQTLSKIDKDGKDYTSRTYVHTSHGVSKFQSHNGKDLSS